jgi:AsmA protein
MTAHRLYSPNATAGRRNPVKRIVRIVAVIAGVLALAIAGLFLFVDVDQFRPALESELTKALGRDVKVGNLKLALLSGGLSASNLSIADDPSFSHDAFLRTKSLTVGVDLVSLLLSRKITVTRITIDEPRIVLLAAPSGTWNFSSLGARAAPDPGADPAPDPPPSPSGSTPALTVKLLKISNGQVLIGTVRGNTRTGVFNKVNLELRDFSTTSQFPFKLSTEVAGGGEVTMEGKAGPIDSSDTALTPVDASLHVTHFDLASSRLLGRSAGFGGVLSMDGQASSTGQVASLGGHLKADRLKVAPNGSPAQRTVEFDFTLQHNLRTHAGVLSQGDIHIGTAVAKLSGTYTLTEDSANVNMNLAGRNMPVPELAGMLPAVGVKLPTGSSLEGGTAHATLMTVGPVERLVTTGSLGIDNTHLRGFDLASKMKFAASVTGIHMGPDTDIQELSASVRSAPDGISVQDIAFVAPSIGTLSGSGAISPSDALDFHMTVKLKSDAGVQVVLGRSIPFFIHGTASAPTFEPDVKGMAAGKVKALGGILGRKAK